MLALVARRPEIDRFKGTGVVLGDGIRFYCKQFDLIQPFNEANLKPANYKLTVGDEFSIGGESHVLVDETGKNEIRISPFEVAVIKTQETVNMPRFLIGRWNIQVKHAYQGLLWVGGPQVDAGYVGHLFCPIYNLSDSEVVLRLGDSFAVIDFVKTTPFIKHKSPEYDLPPERLLLEDYNPRNLRSALVTLVTKQIDEFREKINELEKRTNHILIVGLTLIGILFAALAIIVTGPQSTAHMNSWTFIAIGLAVLAIMIALGK